MILGTALVVNAVQNPAVLVVAAAAVVVAGWKMDRSLGLFGSTSDTPSAIGDSNARIVVEADESEGEVPERIKQKREQYPRAVELQQPTGFINTDSLRLSEAVGQRVILLEFWTFGCYNCQQTHPKLQRFWRQYADEGLLVVGVHYPEFDREREPANVRAYVNDADITYPVVLDNDGGTWDAYDQRYWPARYLIDIDGFVRYTHAGEGAYEETDERIRDLLAEREQVLAES
ncbi:redoxin domain-containing protein [Halonotius terrestris]|uniref:Redoxin domain-containing protein n=1 Tax=Halonotius terrestris TaxID=2487750 RepID=A0A8J8PAN3_9EURY|nr:redoxin domain-containing protein [Halonotius terrestris]TQQ83407.1 redoxin domain-containing protein [Halonotius terrestris]